MNPDVDEPVELAAYDPRWPESFATDAADIQRKLASNVLQVEHFGIQRRGQRWVIRKRSRRVTGLKFQNGGAELAS